ncbi:MAG: putative DNA modification/repair radical SAM protein [Oscillospiraceae bacterium]
MLAKRGQLNKEEKLVILTESAKYDVACTSSGSSREAKPGLLGNTVSGGLCHSFAADGRCISLLKVLFTNYCTFDCAYCPNRRTNDVPRAAFTPDELADIVINFYRRNFIEGLFLSSGVLKSPDYTTELMIKAIEILRKKYLFNGYIHAKAIPGTSPALITRLGLLVDRMSVNLELPSEESLNRLCPDKPRKNILGPMGQIRETINENKHDLAVYRHSPSFVPSGQATQMIIGATPETDFHIVRLAESLYKKYRLRRVFYSAYIPVAEHALLPYNQPVPLLREHRLYQADFLLRFYGFSADEILDEGHPHLDPLLDPKCNWALNHLEQYPVEVNRADPELLLRVPGMGPKSVEKIIAARRTTRLTFEDLKKLRVVLRRAVYFITCDGRMMPGVKLQREYIYHNLLADNSRSPAGMPFTPPAEQLSLYHASHESGSAFPQLQAAGI